MFSGIKSFFLGGGVGGYCQIDKPALGERQSGWIESGGDRFGQ